MSEVYLILQTFVYGDTFNTAVGPFEKRFDTAPLVETLNEAVFGAWTALAWVSSVDDLLGFNHDKIRTFDSFKQSQVLHATRAHKHAQDDLARAKVPDSEIAWAQERIDRLQHLVARTRYFLDKANELSVPA